MKAPDALRRAGAVVAVLLQSGAVACGEAGDAPRAGFVVTDSAGIAIVELGDPAALALPEWHVDEPHFTLGGASAEGTDRALFRVRSAHLLDDGGLLVVNGGAQELLRFDAEGTRTRRIGGAGDGPGEFRAPEWVGALGEASLAVYDVRHARFTLLDGEGTVTGTRAAAPPQLPGYVAGIGGVVPEPRGATADGTMLFSPGFNRVFGTSGTRVDTLVHFLAPSGGGAPILLTPIPDEPRFFASIAGPDGSTGAMTVSVPFGGRPFAGAGGERVALATSERWEVLLFDASGASVARVRALPVRPRVTSEDAAAWTESRLAGASSDRRASLEEAYAQVPFPERHPALEGLHVDRAGRTWIGEALPPGRDVRRWLVLDPGGEPLARVSLPAEVRILDVTDEEIVVVGQDDLDVEELRVLGYS